MSQIVAKITKMWMKTVEYSQNLNLDISYLFPYSRMYVLSNDTTHNSLRWIYRSAKIDWTKKTIWVYSSSLTSKVGVGAMRYLFKHSQNHATTAQWPVINFKFKCLLVFVCLLFEEKKPKSVNILKSQFPYLSKFLSTWRFLELKFAQCL